jgi:hypothetical protein
MKQTFEIYYMRPEFFPHGIMGQTDRIDRKRLEQTHIHLKDVEAHDLEEVYAYMQAETWSPSGEAQPLIKAKGLKHTSMSTGDVAVAADGCVYVVAMFGFLELT